VLVKIFFLLALVDYVLLVGRLSLVLSLASIVIHILDLYFFDNFTGEY